MFFEGKPPEREGFLTLHVDAFLLAMTGEAFSTRSA